MNLDPITNPDEAKAAAVANSNARATPQNPRGFFQRNGWLFLWLFLSACLTLIQPLYERFGTFIFAPLYTIGSFLMAGLLRRLFNKTTTEEDARLGVFDKNWDDLDGRTKVILHQLQFLVYFIGAVLIFAALAK